MKYTLFVQSGNTKQAKNNAMYPHVFTFGASHHSWGNAFEIKDNQRGGKLSGPAWSIAKRHATTFRLEFIF